MWEAIRDNARRSRLVIGLMGALLVGFGALIGAAYAGTGAALPGALAALGVWALLWIVAVTSGSQIVLGTARAREIAKADHPQLWNVVEEMTIAAGLGTMPRVFIVDDDAPNAFATGLRPHQATVAVTTGLLRRLNRDELQGVIAHEIGHIRNLDIRFLTIAAVMVGSIAIVADLFLRSMWYGGGRRTGRGGQGQALMMVFALVAAILAPIFAQLLYFVCSRGREYLADASAARFTRYPDGLASALEKIAGSAAERGGRAVPRILAPMYIVNPLQATSGVAGWFATHPPTARRVAVLRAMGANAGWVDYDRAYRQVTGESSAGIGARTLAAESSLAARAASVESPQPQETRQSARAVTDLLDGLAGFVLVPCACGVRIKVPPQFERPTVRCPRCGRQHETPRAGGGASQQADEETPLHVRRSGTGWEALRCRCNHVIQLSPAFRGRSTRCPRCNRRIEVEGP